MSPDRPEEFDEDETTSPVSRFTGEYAHDFEIWSECYDSAREVSVLRDRLPLGDTRLLNTGCGTGRLAFPLASYTQEIVGVDEQPDLIDLCRDRQSSHDRSHLSFEAHDIADLPHSDGEFDLAIDTWLFSSLNDPTPVAEEYGRVVANGGHLAVITGRNGSEYEEVLQKVGSQYGYDAESVETTLREHFGTPLTTVDIVSPYIYRSVEEAYDAFDFHFEEWFNVSLTDDQREAVHEQIRKHKWDSSVRLHEYARVHIFQNSAIEPFTTPSP